MRTEVIMVISFLLFELPVFAVIGLLLYAPIYWIGKRRTGKRPFLRHFVLWTFLCYCLSLTFLTLLWYWPDITFRPELFFLNLRPFVWVTETYEMGVTKMLEQLALNIGMFVPLGILLPMVFPRLRRFWRTALVVLLTTAAIETLQYFMGRSADIDDVIMNFAGGVLGYALFVLLRRLFGKCRWWRNAIGEKADIG